jgi:hypothetical protein
MKSLPIPSKLGEENSPWSKYKAGTRGADLLVAQGEVCVNPAHSRGKNFCIPNTINMRDANAISWLRVLTMTATSELVDAFKTAAGSRGVGMAGISSRTS